MILLEVFLKMLIRLSVGLLSLMLYMNLLGRMQLSPQSALDQIGNYILGGILGGIIYNLDLEFYKFFMAIIIWTGLMLFVTYITQNNLKAKRVIKGKPILLMEDNKFNTEEFDENKINIDELISNLHQKGIFTISEIDTIWLEPNGELTIIKIDEEDIAWVLIEDGEINEIDLSRLKKDEEWLKIHIKNYGYTDIEDIFYAEYLNGKFIIQGYN